MKRIGWISLGVLLGVVVALPSVWPRADAQDIFDPGAWGVAMDPKGKMAILRHGETGATYVHFFKEKPATQWHRMTYLHDGVETDLPIPTPR